MPEGRGDVRVLPDGRREAVRYRGWTARDFGAFRGYARDDARPEPAVQRGVMPAGVTGDPVRGRALFLARAKGPCTGCREPLTVSESLLYRRGNFNGPFDELILDALLAHGDAEVAFSPGFRWEITILPGQSVTLEDVYAHTALTYPGVWARPLTGAEIVALMEDVADNLFHPDPYYRQGGDMVRVGGLTYAIAPERPRGARIRDVEVRGRPLDPARRYKATGWASLTATDGPPVWDVVAAHLRSVKRLRLDGRPRVRVVPL